MCKVDELAKSLLAQLPNMGIALLSLAYLARQNERALMVMQTQIDRQFSLLEKMCNRCIDDPK